MFQAWQNPFAGSGMPMPKSWIDKPTVVSNPEYTKGYAGVAPGTLRCGIDDRGNRVVVLTSTRSSAASDAQGRISCNQYLHLAYLHLWSVCAHPDSCGSRLSGMYNLTRWRWG
ncbi:MAG: hypothetical protein ACI855_003562 [Myxococcota bacterium]|jgi:hypothetical protein